MARILVLTTDLPYFPGKMGVDFFNLRHVAQEHQVDIVAPCYDWFPTEGVANLRRAMHRLHLWPEPVCKLTPFAPGEPNGRLCTWLAGLPRGLRWWILRRLLGIHRRPSDAYDKLAVLSNCAPHLCEALASGHPQVIVLIQTSLEPWLDYLPALGSKLFYFHDVRADYMKRVIPMPGQERLSAREIAAIQRQEQQVTQRAEVVAFVSELDQTRAKRMFQMRATSGVAPIPVDTDYYYPAPDDWKRDPRPIVLFTGHLSHPPNVDAVLYFIREIWPQVLSYTPNAILQVVGMMPAPVVEEAAVTASQCELHPNVPDIRPYFWNSCVYVVPMRFGGGVRQKIYESWSMRVPVVCTTMAAEGAGVSNGVQCWLEDEPSAFARRVSSVLGQQRQDDMVDAAKIHVEANNSLEVAAPRFQSMVETAVHIHRHRPYKLLYDLRWMELGRAGGTEQATYELIDAIGRLDQRNSYRLFAPRAACCEWNFPPAFKVRRHYSDSISRHGEVLRSFLTNRLSEGLQLPVLLNPHMRSLAELRRMDFNLVHSVCGYTHPDLLGYPGILTINDLQHLHYPQFFSTKEWQEREKLYRESATRAQHIICISEFTRQDVHRQYGIPLEKMSTVWIIPSRNVWSRLDGQEMQSLLAGMGLVPEGFIFFPAHCWAHKNHARLVEAFHRVLSDLPKGLKLIFTGREFPTDHPAAEYIAGHGLGERIRHLGFRSPLEMRALFQGCQALVFASLFEGYGMPVAEALIAGKPVACSNVTSLPEIAGQAAITFDPTDVDDISSCLMEVVSNQDLRTKLETAARQQRLLFSARRSAIQTLAIYHRVYAETFGGS